MKALFKRSKIKKIVIITLISVTGLLLSLSLFAFLIFHNYVSKMNLVHGISMEAAINENSAIPSDSTQTGENAAPPPQDSQVLNNSTDAEADAEVDNSLPDSTQEEITLLEEEMRKNMGKEGFLKEEEKEVLNILLIGSDTRTNKERGRSDTMLLISINKKAKMITATSLLRDIYLEIPGYKDNRLNAAYQFGGADLLIDTIEQNFKIQIDHYVSVNFFTFIDIVDAVGGITVDVTQKEVEPVNGYIREINSLKNEEADKDILTMSGPQLLNGKQALGYTRVRSVGNNDFRRTERQRIVMQLIFDQVKKLSLLQLNDLLNLILPQVTTDFTEGEIFNQLLSLPSYIDYGTEQWSIPLSDSYKDLRIRGMAVLGIDFDENIREIRRRIYLTE